MRLTEPRINPVEEADWTESQRALLAPQRMRGRIQNIFLTLANHEALAKRWMVFANHILHKSKLSARDRELLILRVGWLCQSGYEWGQHVLIGKKAGISDLEIEAIKVGPTDPSWSIQDALLLTATDELRADAFVTDPTWQALAGLYSEQQLMDLVFTVGQYQLVSMALNTFGVQLDPDLPIMK
ncbi:MAG: alkylhydroperoxidase family enzyme [Candidatus Azotimanducaceae bacterium]|mgnify:FL=1|jgi:alkylhydroperoxidase family enzyme|tara:strand:- start:1132 stop:1683 length:552 start_codon:yes stop_codon:yes gene_type:complete